MPTSHRQRMLSYVDAFNTSDTARLDLLSKIVDETLLAFEGDEDGAAEAAIDEMAAKAAFLSDVCAQIVNAIEENRVITNE